MNEFFPKSPHHDGPDGHVSHFRDVTIDFRRQTLVRGGLEIRLRGKSFDVLAYLVRHAGRVVDKRELIDAVWGGVAVSDDSLVQCLVEIRRNLGEAQDVIKTVRGRGYMLDADIDAEAPAAPAVDVVPVNRASAAESPRARARRAAHLGCRHPCRALAVEHGRPRRGRHRLRDARSHLERRRE